MFVIIIMFFSILAKISNWNEVGEALYPGWKKIVHVDGIVTLEPQGSDMDKPKDANMCNNDVLFVLLPNEDNMNQFQPKVWLWDAYEQNRLDVMRFLLMKGCKLPAVAPKYVETESRLAYELDNLCRTEYISLFLLYEPIDLNKKWAIISPYVMSLKINALQIIAGCVELLYERMLGGADLIPEYESPGFFNELPY